MGQYRPGRVLLRGQWFNLAQTASNRLLNAFGVAGFNEQVPEITTCCFGLDIGTERGLAVLNQLCSRLIKGCSMGTGFLTPLTARIPAFCFAVTISQPCRLLPTCST